jgi:hypothetical protein
MPAGAHWCGEEMLNAHWCEEEKLDLKSMPTGAHWFVEEMLNAHWCEEEPLDLKCENLYFKSAPAVADRSSEWGSFCGHSFYLSENESFHSHAREKPVVRSASLVSLVS